ncbi:MAG: heparinase II/III family protein, partial [Armatimonadota bacterium]
MILHITCITAMLLCVAGIAGPPQQGQGYWPPEEDVREALEEFDAYPKPGPFRGRGVKERVEKLWAQYTPGEAPPEAGWVEYWMDKSDEFIYDMISPENPRSLVPNYNQGCPLHKGNIRTLRPVWGKPDTFRCIEGGEEWAPGMTVENPETGEMVQIVDDGHGWQPPEGFPQRQKFYFKASYRLFLIRMLISGPYVDPVEFDGPDPDDHRPVVEALAWAYAATGEQKYADRALLILNRFAENYRWYNGRVDTKVDWRKFHNRGYIADGIFEPQKIETMAAAYDLVFAALEDADEVVEFFSAHGAADYNGDGTTDTEDLRYNIEHNLFGYMWEFFKRSYTRGTSNAKMFQMAGMANLALIFQNDAIIEELIEGPCGVRHGVIGSFYREGRSHEDSSSYSRGVNNAYLKIARLLSAYEGREIYTDGLDVYEEFGSRFPMIEAWVDRVTCDGVYLAYGDGGHGHWRATPKETGECEPALVAHELGLTFMRMGDNPQTKLHALLYHPVGGVGHGHRDELMLKISKYGYDFTADIGYPANLGSQKRRDWTNNSITHPVVLIDETPQQRGVTASEDAFGSCDWAQMQSAYSYDTYPDARLYHRTAVVVQVDADHHFVIDLFRVIGGTQHDLPFHSLSGDEGTNFAISCEGSLDERLGTLAGEKAEYQGETENGYTYIKDIKHG